MGSATNTTAEQAKREAIQWAVTMKSGEASATDERKLDDWLASSEENRQAWARLARSLTALLPTSGVDSAATRETLSRVHSDSRRKVIFGSVSALVAVCGAAWICRTSKTDYVGAGSLVQTVAAERRKVAVADGVSLTLNARSTVRNAINTPEHAIYLHAGAIYIDASATGARRVAFQVKTRDGLIAAENATLGVSLVDQGTRVAAVRTTLSISTAAGHRELVSPGDTVTFNRDTIWRQNGNTDAYTSWTKGMFIASNTPLGDVVNALQPYVNGVLHITADAATRRVSGIFSLDHPQQSVDQIEQTLNLRVVRITPYVTLIST